MATPGHTPEHVAYLLLDPDGVPTALFSGGALMVGTAARTDLFGRALTWRFAHDLERSLKGKILALPDDVMVYPTHGGGSFCAAGAGNALFTTIGAERSSNRPARARGSRRFVIEALTAGPYPTDDTPKRGLNQAGAPLLGQTPPAPSAVPLDEFDLWVAQGALVLDVRPATASRKGQIPRSVAVGADGDVSGWVGWLVGPERPLVLVADPGQRGESQIREAVRQLARIGDDRIVGALDGGIDSWSGAGRALVSYETTSAAGLAKRLDADHAVVVVDVREAAGWHAGHIPGSVNIPAHEIPTSRIELPHGIPLALHCRHDCRATFGASLLERAGYGQLLVVEDGWGAWIALDHAQ